MEKSKTGIIAAVVHELVKAQQFTSLSDLSEAVKVNCARLRIRYDGGLIHDAIRLVERTRRVVSVEPPKPVIGRAVEVAPMTRQDAARVYRELMQRFAVTQPVVVMAGAPEHFPSLVRVSE